MTERVPVPIIGRAAVIAGNGLLPEVLAKELARRGQAPVIAGISGEVGTWISEYPNFLVRTVEIGRLVKELKARGVTNIVLAGGVRSRPVLSSIKLDWITVSSVPTFLRALRRGDDGLMRAFMNVMHRQGFNVLGVHEVMPDLLAPSGTMTEAGLSKQDKEDCVRAQEAARALGGLDIGQGAVAVGGRVVAVEGAEGTNAMLLRVAEMREAGRIGRKRGGVLVKIAKPGQEMRADLPTIGPETVDNARKADLAGIAVEADASLILEFEKTVRRANDAKMFIHGLRGA